ncbi:MAG TPA: Na+/H+ antiporter subunit E [Flavisolibacter sp.]|jgi:multicomponent Na+:H+ antiporter subunit E|nr:Na+/H+ antiporter subunit E [Flavisolibacter sp.]
MANRFLMNILLTLVWIALTGQLNFTNFLFGYILSFIILWIIARGYRERGYFYRVPKIIGFILFFFKELVKANLQVAYEVVTPRFSMKPGIVKIDLDAKTDLEITLLANLITLTPGTLSLDVSDDRKVLYVHAMHVRNRARFVQSIKQGFEKRLLEILR